MTKPGGGEAMGTRPKDRKLTVTFPDGTTGSRRSPRPYTFVLASRLDKPRRPERDIVRYRYEKCAEGATIREAFEPAYAALRAETNLFDGDPRTSASRTKRWHTGFDEIYHREDAARKAHAATCPKGCTGSGTIAIEVSRKPERTGWLPISWHHSRALAEKALATARTAYATKGHDEVRIFPVDGTENGGRA